MYPRYQMTDHEITVPLNHDDPTGAAIQVFAREVVDPALAGTNPPWLVYLQGGPGGKSPRPQGGSPGWLSHALKTHRVLLLDQRGTGRSTPVTPSVAARFGSAEDLAQYLSFHRADSIVRDAELIRHRLCGHEPWSLLGQSFGGFITLTYLSQAPQWLRACYIAGGIPGLSATADDVYARTYPRVAAKNAEYYERYPDDVRRVRQIADLLDSRDVRLPDGDRLTTPRLQTLGRSFGSGAGFERVHWLLEEAFCQRDELGDAFLSEVMQSTGSVDVPLYAVLQEACYGQGAKPTAWAAQRALTDHPAFAPNADPLLFTGEMMYPWMFQEIRALRPFAEAAEILAQSAWPPLYDPAQLAANRVPVAAAVYHDDMYVDADLSLQTLRGLGSSRYWITNEWEHDGLAASGGAVLAHLMDMVGGHR